MQEKIARGKTTRGRDRPNQSLGHENPREIPWWYHGLARGWLVAEVTENEEPMVGWKGKHMQLAV